MPLQLTQSITNQSRAKRRTSGASPAFSQVSKTWFQAARLLVGRFFLCEKSPFLLEKSEKVENFSKKVHFFLQNVLRNTKLFVSLHHQTTTE